MAEYIERETALQFVFDACAECMDACEEFDGIYADCNQCMLEGVKLKLRDLPAADVRPVVRGEWKNGGRSALFPGQGIYRCSECDHHYFTRFNFCPNCGAKMGGGNMKPQRWKDVFHWGFGYTVCPYCGNETGWYNPASDRVQSDIENNRREYCPKCHKRVYAREGLICNQPPKEK